MRVLGIDPGSAITGWGLLDGPRTRPRLVESGVFRLSAPGIGFPERLHGLARGLDEVVRRLLPEVAAVEAPFHGVNARSALQLAHARGVILATLAGAGVPVTEYAPAAIKMAVAGNGRAYKDQIHAMVVRLLALDSLPGPSDRADAIAVALCHVASMGHPRVASRSAPSRRLR